MDRVDEDALVRRAKAGNEEAVEALIRAHQDALYQFILRMSGRRDTAEDIVQEAFVRVLGSLGRFDSRYRFSTWLFTIARRLYVNASRKLGPAYDSAAIDARPACLPGPGRAAAGRETMRNARSLVDEALAGLPPHQREIILLYHQQSWPVAEIAEHLSLPLGTVKSHLYRGRRRMRRYILGSRLRALHVEEVLAS